MSSFPLPRPLVIAATAVMLAIGSFPAESFAESIDTAARQAMIVDFNTGAVLLEKNSDDLMTPSSMSKLMTVYMVFSRLKDGSLKEGDLLPVSETAWKKHTQWNRKGDSSVESTMFLDIHSQAKVEDLLRGVIIQSGNDACSVLAEGLAGSEEAFAEQETRKGREIGLTKSTFRNASGMPEPGHQMTAHDLATLARRLISDFPDRYPIFAERSFTYNGKKQDNRNPLIWQNIAGADGMKTGHTEEGGFGLVGTAARNGRRVIVVLNGLPTQKSRAEESQRLIEWAFREFDDYNLFKTGDAVTDADVWLGQAGSVPLVAGSDLFVTLPRTARHDMKVVASFTGPVPAPVKKGTQVGIVTVSVPGMADIQVPLVAGADVERLGFFGRIGSAVRQILWGSKA